MQKSGRTVLGVLLILFGGFFLMTSLGYIDRYNDVIWPFFIFLPGIAFHVAFFVTGAKKSAAGILVPGGILVVNDEISYYLRDHFTRLLEPKGINVEEWKHDGDHIHVLFRSVPNIDLSKAINSYKSVSFCNRK